MARHETTSPARFAARTRARIGDFPVAARFGPGRQPGRGTPARDTAATARGGWKPRTLTEPQARWSLALGILLVTLWLTVVGPALCNFIDQCANWSVQ